MAQQLKRSWGGCWGLPTDLPPRSWLVRQASGWAGRGLSWWLLANQEGHGRDLLLVPPLCFILWRSPEPCSALAAHKIQMVTREMPGSRSMAGVSGFPVNPAFFCQMITLSPLAELFSLSIIKSLLTILVPCQCTMS